MQELIVAAWNALRGAGYRSGTAGSVDETRTVLSREWLPEHEPPVDLVVAAMLSSVGPMRPRPFRECVCGLSVVDSRGSRSMVLRQLVVHLVNELDAEAEAAEAVARAARQAAADSKALRRIVALRLTYGYVHADHFAGQGVTPHVVSPGEDGYRLPVGYNDCLGCGNQVEDPFTACSKECAVRWIASFAWNGQDPVATPVVEVWLERNYPVYDGQPEPAHMIERRRPIEAGTPEFTSHWRQSFFPTSAVNDKAAE